MRIFICDNCKAQFPQPLDQEMYKDGSEWKLLDLCAPCRKLLKDQRDSVNKSFFDKAKEKK